MVVVKMVLDKSGFSQEIVTFLTSLLSVALKVMLFFTAAGIFGIDTATFIAVLAAASFAVGLALQGSLGNFTAYEVIKKAFHDNNIAVAYSKGVEIGTIGD